jgi:hypothetical protein
MKTNLKALQLIEKGLSAKTVHKLTESQINVLHKRLIVEEIKKTVTNVTYDPSNSADQQKLAQMGVHIDPSSKKITMSQTGGEITTENELDEQGGVEVDKDDASAGEYTQDMPQKSAPDGMDDDLDNPKEKNMIGAVESIEEAKKKGKKDKNNPWSICTAQLGKEFGTRERHLWSAKEKNKYERCVKDVKQSLKEGKNPVSLFLESQIMKIVEKNLPPKITKGDLLKYLSEAPATAPSKPKTSPTTKPGKPGTKPQKPPSPFKNPNPNENPAPKAKKVSAEDAKDEVIDAIIKLLRK